MKFHHLARHNQFVGTQQQRDVSPAKQQQQQQATAMLKSQHLNNLSDDEDEEFNETQGYYDAIDQHHHIQSQNQHANNQQPVDTNGFLMDKNKKLFPQKLWELIHNPSIQHCLRWSQDGQRVYLNRNEFEAYYLKTPNNQFHTQKAISFVRQMNMYGFRKVDDCYYENDNFRRDRQHLLRNMIRRHPNKGLFVGLDHHQLAAAAAAQQALQVNQQLQQLEHQHKHRTEQALRLNSYLNNHHHQFHHQTAGLAHGHSHHQLHSHSSPFEHMSSQLAQAAANHLSQQQHHQHIHHQHQHQNSNINNSSSNNNNTTINNNNLNNNQPPSLPVHHQPKKSRLLSNFYASTASNNNNIGANNRSVYADNSPANQLIHNQDSMHSTSSVDTQPSQCSSVVNSGSAGSPQPNSPSVLHQRLAALSNRHQSSTSSSSIRAAVLAAAQESSTTFPNVTNKFATSNMIINNDNNNTSQHAATDLSNQSLATRQALHQTLVRSLLQLKQHQHPQDLLASLQHQNPRSLLESLASLSSAGTGSIVDPASNSPTERTATPPSSPPSPEISRGLAKYGEASQYMDNNNIALNLAKSSNTSFNMKRQLEADVDYAVDIEDEVEGEEDETEIEEGEEVDEESGEVVLDAVESPLDGPKKVRQFLDNQMLQQKRVEETIGIKREPTSPDSNHLDHTGLPQKKRIKLANNNTEDATTPDDELRVSSISKSLIIEICDRRGDQLDVQALHEVARYTQCFLEILLDDASLIARHSSIEYDHKDIKSDSNDNGRCKSKKGNIVDTSSLSLALKLIPSKLLAAIQQQVNIKTQSSTGSIN